MTVEKFLTVIYVWLVFATLTNGQNFDGPPRNVFTQQSQSFGIPFTQPHGPQNTFSPGTQPLSFTHNPQGMRKPIIPQIPNLDSMILSSIFSPQSTTPSFQENRPTPLAPQSPIILDSTLIHERPGSSFGHPQQTSPFNQQQTSRFPPQQTNYFNPQQTSPFNQQQTSRFPPQQTNSFNPQQTSPFNQEQTSRFPPQQTSSFNPQPTSPFNQQQPNSFLPQQPNPFNSQQPNSFNPQQPNPFNPQNSNPFIHQNNNPFNHQNNNPFNHQNNNPFNHQNNNPFNQQNTNPFNHRNTNPFNHQNNNPFNHRNTNPFNHRNTNPFIQQNTNPFNHQNTNPFNQQSTNPFIPQHTNLFTSQQPFSPQQSTLKSSEPSILEMNPSNQPIKNDFIGPQQASQSYTSPQETIPSSSGFQQSIPSSTSLKQTDSDSIVPQQTGSDSLGSQQTDSDLEAPQQIDSDSKQSQQTNKDSTAPQKTGSDSLGSQQTDSDSEVPQQTDSVQSQQTNSDMPAPKQTDSDLTDPQKTNPVPDDAQPITSASESSSSISTAPTAPQDITSLSNKSENSTGTPQGHTSKSGYRPQSNSQPSDDSLEGLRIVCLFNNRHFYKSGFTPSQIEPHLCTHLNYEFALLDPKTYEIIIGEPELDIEMNFYGATLELKLINPYLKVLLSLGGWADSTKKYSELCASPDKRANFVVKTVEFLKKHEFDGLDFAWEYPNCWQGALGVSPKDKKNFVILLEELKTEFQKHDLILSVSVGAIKREIEAAYDVPRISKIVDYMNVMTYDMHGPWETKTSHHVQFEAKHGDADPYCNVKGGIQVWIEKGADKKKINMGCAMYGRTFTLADPNNCGMGVPAIGPGAPGPRTKEGGILNYNEICDYLNSGNWTEKEDRKTGFFACSENQFVCYDPPMMMVRKARYVVQFGLGGVLLKDLSGDDFSGKCFSMPFPLTKMMKLEMIHKLKQKHSPKN